MGFIPFHNFFLFDSYTEIMYYSALLNISFFTIQLKSDYDTGDFTIKYILSGEGAGELFIIDEYTGDIQVIKCLDREQKDFYILQAQAINRRSKQPAEPESEFIIKVQDINDNAPEFINEPYVSSIPEMCPTGKLIPLQHGQFI